MAEKIENIPIEETLKLIQARASGGEDNFNVKINRRRGLTGFPELICTLSGATIQHLAYSEVWLKKLAGGGQYLVAVYAPDQPSTKIGGFMTFNFNGEPHEVNPRATQDPYWEGPPKMIFPVVEQGALDLMQQIASPIGGSSGAGSGFPQVGAANPNVPVGFPPPQFLPPPQQVAPDWLRQAEDRLLAKERALEERERRAREEVAKEEARLREERLRAEFEAKQRDMEARFAAQVASTVKPPAESNVEKLVTVLAPLGMQLLKMQADAREADARWRAEQAKEAAAREDRLAAAAAAREERLMMLDRERDRDRGGGTAELMGKMAEMVATFAEIKFDDAPPEHPMAPVLKEVVKAITTVGAGLAAGNRPPPIQQRALPPQQQPRQAQVVPINPVQTTNPPPPAPGPTPVQKTAFAGYEQAAQGDPMATLVNAVHAYAPPAEVASYFLGQLNHPVMVQELQEVNGDWTEMLARKFLAWIQASEQNQAYARAVMDEITRQGRAMGVIAPEETQPQAPEEAEYEDEEDEDGGEEASG